MGILSWKLLLTLPMMKHLIPMRLTNGRTSAIQFKIQRFTIYLNGEYVLKETSLQVAGNPTKKAMTRSWGLKLF